MPRIGVLLLVLTLLPCLAILVAAEPTTKPADAPATSQAASGSGDASLEVILSAKGKFKAGEPVKLMLRVRNPNAELDVARGIIELRPEGGKYDLMRVAPVAKREGKPDGGDQVWELVIAGDAEISVWDREPVSSMMLPPIKGLLAGKYQARWFEHYSPVDWKYKSGKIEIEIVEADKPAPASKPTTTVAPPRLIVD